ncbi:MAG: flagellar export chaperone FliS [Actinomycetota bacterium]|nr:flagellar export chaperone FliS [Actinomycetota bacterium]
MTNPAAERYLTERVMTASPAELTGMLFDAAVGAVKSAVRLHEADQHVLATPRLIKAQEIVLELRFSLNKEAGPLADRLEQLYAYTYGLLVEANVKRNTAAAREALQVLEPLQLAWRESCLQVAA